MPLSEFADDEALLVSTFNDLFWYFPDTDTYRIAHTGEGRYYGTAAVDAACSSLFVVSRPDQERDDVLLEVSLDSGTVTRRVPLASRDTHQMIRHGDRLLVTDTFRGRLLVYSLPEVSFVRCHDLFQYEHHVNSVRVMPEGVYLLCHNFGPSRLVLIEPESGRVLEQYDDVGVKSHDIVPYGSELLLCDSAAGGLIALDKSTRRTRVVHAEAGHWTKGLVVRGDTAFFGDSEPSERENRYFLKCSIVAVDLVTGRVLWRRPMARTGLINALATRETLEHERRGVCEPLSRRV
jgi:hypothetical protein